jgi:membrane protease YdiL (CAAX protease family)
LPISHQLRVFFVLAFGLSWAIGGIGLVVGLMRPELRPLSTSSPLYYLAAYSVSLSGIILTARYAGLGGLRDLGRRLVPWQAEARWYLIVVFGYAAITGISLGIGGLLRPASFGFPGPPALLSVLLLTLVRDPGPLGEELGWRGFALPRLLERRSPLRASAILGLVHAAWHLPLFFIPAMPQTQLSFPLFTIGVVAIAIFQTALYLRTGANLLLAILVHLLANVGGGLAASAQALNIFFVAEGVAAALVVVCGALKRCPNRRR